MSTFKLTYATMFNPPEELHARFENALAEVRAHLGQEYGLLINNQDVFSTEKLEDRSPINTEWVLAILQKGQESHARQALAAARRAFPSWSRTPWQERVRLLRRVAAVIEERLYTLAAALSLEVGKNRMEALGDVQECADLISYACDQMEANEGFIRQMGKDPLPGYEVTNRSVMRPYGVWLVISPFNFPCALTAGPAGAALVTGNTVVIKPASDTPWIVRLLAECFREAGLPEGVCNFVTGPGETLGQALVDSAEVDGLTFTGSHQVGMRIFRHYASGNHVRPVILELGGKNPVIVSRHADLERAAAGILRSAFGLQGQKCSAASRVYIEAPIYATLTERLKVMTEQLTIGDPTDRSVFFGPVINKNAYTNFQAYLSEIEAAGGHFLTGGQVLTKGNLAKGYFCAPTLVTDLPVEHRLWKYEMFLPITLLTSVANLEVAMRLANDSNYGLTAGFYGSEEEAAWFFDRIEAGVTYANRPQGATTGAWPGFQPFGGWKGSGATGKNAGGLYYLPLYLREQTQTLVR